MTMTAAHSVRRRAVRFRAAICLIESEEEYRAATARQFAGTPDDVAADLQRRVLDPGVEGIIVNLVPNGHEPGVVTMVGEMPGKLLR